VATERLQDTLTLSYGRLARDTPRRLVDLELRAMLRQPALV
jgi:hypothetical protein